MHANEKEIIGKHELASFNGTLIMDRALVLSILEKDQPNKTLTI